VNEGTGPKKSGEARPLGLAPQGGAACVFPIGGARASRPGPTWASSSGRVFSSGADGSRPTEAAELALLAREAV
jgi:hypothetical protein